MFISLLCCSLILLIDQLIKYFYFRLNLSVVKNYGFGFGLLNDQKYLRISYLLNLLIILFFIIGWFRFKKNRLPILIIITGGVSNLIDRLGLGYVIDYWDLKFWFTRTVFIKWPVFNFADLMISFGIIWLIYEAFAENYLRR